MLELELYASCSKQIPLGQFQDAWKDPKTAAKGYTKVIPPPPANHNWPPEALLQVFSEGRQAAAGE